jgi:hypothetical protein
MTREQYKHRLSSMHIEDIREEKSSLKSKIKKTLNSDVLDTLDLFNKYDACVIEINRRVTCVTYPIKVNIQDGVRI